MKHRKILSSALSLLLVGALVLGPVSNTIPCAYANEGRVESIETTSGKYNTTGEWETGVDESLTYQEGAVKLSMAATTTDPTKNEVNVELKVEVTEGATIKPVSVQNPLSDYVSLIERAPEGYDAESGTWTLGKPETTTLENEKKLDIYTLKYKVALKEEFFDGNFHPICEKTTLVTDLPENTMEFPAAGLKIVPAYFAFSVSAKWVGKNGVEEEPADGTTMAFTLVRNGVPLMGKELILNKENNWTYVYAHLPAHNAEGEIYSYSIQCKELSGYTTTIGGSQYKNFVIKQEQIADPYEVNYSFISNDGVELPSKILEMIPENYIAYTGDKVVPESPQVTSLNIDHEIWTFDGWDKNEVVVNQNVAFVGTWSHTPETSYKVRYEFKDKNGGVIPPEIAAFLPAESVAYNGDLVSPAFPTDTSYKIEHTFWTFDGWDHDALEVNGNDIVFVGTWSSETKTPYTVEYKFASEDDKDLPKEVLDQIPADNTIYYNGDVVLAKDFEKTSMNINHEIWTFEGWDSPEQTVDNANILFVGKWSHTPETSYTVNYRFSGWDNLPEIVRELLPSDSGKYYTGDTVVAKTPNATVIDVVKGFWYFDGWNANEQTVDGNNIEFVGSWHYVAAPTYNANFRFESSTANRELPHGVLAYLPANITGLYSGATVEAPSLSANSWREATGSWVFDGWDKSSVQVGGGDVSFVGYWSFVPDPIIDTGNVTVSYRFVSGESGEALPTQIQQFLPVSQPDVDPEAAMNPAAPLRTSALIGGVKWVFEGWTNRDVNEDKTEVIYTGRWIIESEQGSVDAEDAGGVTQPEIPSHAVPTGDFSHIWFYIALAGASVAAVIITIATKRRKKSDN